MWSRGAPLPAWAEAMALLGLLWVLPVGLMTFLAPPWTLKLMKKACLGTVGLISVLSLLDFAWSMERWWRAKREQAAGREETQCLLQGRAARGAMEEPLQLSILLPCYLPNETDIIETTLDRVIFEMEYNSSYQVVLVYNSVAAESESDAVKHLEGRLKRRAGSYVIGRSNRELVVKKCSTSSSKAENINYALAFCSGNVIGILDADHLPDKDAFREVCRLWTPNTSAIQGSSYVRNASKNLLTKLISIEEALVFHVHHSGGSVWRGFGVFGGSNGFWRKDFLSNLHLDKKMLTEDIDVTLRALHRGAVVRHEPSVVTSELVPETLPLLWRQRLRWAQGWFQCSYKHFSSLMVSERTTFRQKIGITAMFLMREVWYYLMPTSAVLTCSVAIRRYFHMDGKHMWVKHDSLISQIIVFLFVVTFTCELLVSYAVTPRRRRLSYAWVVFGIILFIPFVYFLVIVGITAQFREMYGCQEWHVTARTKAQDPEPV